MSARGQETINLLQTYALAPPGAQRVLSCREREKAFFSESFHSNNNVVLVKALQTPCCLFSESFKR
eukprot:3894103-Lingulodinium_polyedra.AAC.1